MISVTSAGSPSSGFSRAQLSVGRRSSPGFANGRRYSAISSSRSWRRTPLIKICSKRGCSSAIFSPTGGRPVLSRFRGLFIPVVPAARLHERPHVGDAADRVAVPVGPVEAEPRAPVVDDQGDALTHPEVLQQGVEIATVLDEAVRPGTGVRQLVGVTHADQVRRDAASEGLQVGQHVPPQVGRRGVSVQQYDRIALADFYIGHVMAEYPPPLLL